MEHPTFVGMDIADHSFALHGASQVASKELSKSLERSEVLDSLSEQPSCSATIECCGGARNERTLFMRRVR